MIQLLTNAIVITALGGVAIAVALAVVKLVVSFATLGSSKLDSTVVLENTCKYCGHTLGEETQCEYCGAVRQ